MVDFLSDEVAYALYLMSESEASAEKHVDVPMEYRFLLSASDLDAMTYGGQYAVVPILRLLDQAQAELPAGKLARKRVIGKLIRSKGADNKGAPKSLKALNVLMSVLQFVPAGGVKVDAISFVKSGTSDRGEQEFREAIKAILLHPFWNNFSASSTVPTKIKQHLVEVVKFIHFAPDSVNSHEVYYIHEERIGIATWVEQTAHIAPFLKSAQETTNGLERTQKQSVEGTTKCF